MNPVLPAAVHVAQATLLVPDLSIVVIHPECAESQHHDLTHVLCRVQGQNYVLDLMHSPGSLYAAESAEAAAYIRTGRQGVGGAGLNSCSAGEPCSIGVNSNNVGSSGQCH